MNKIMLKKTDYSSFLAVGLLSITMASGIISSSLRVNADSNDTAVSTASVTVEASCSMTATIDTAHTANIPNGIYSGTSLYPNGIGKTNIATFCNDNGGYAIYAIGYSGDQYSGADHTKLLGTGGEKIATGTATSGDTSNWAMKLTKVTDSTQSYNPQNLSITNGYDSFSAVPDTYTKVANYTSTTDKTLGSVLSTTYAAYISGTQPADTYTGKVKYTLVHPNTEVPTHPETTQSGQICYYPNGSNVVGTMGCDNVFEHTVAIPLQPSNYSREGYGFAGWNTEFDYTGDFYGPSEIISFAKGTYTGSNPGLSLYAIWVKSVGSIQDSSKVATVCSGLTQAGPSVTPTLNSVSALTDQRDNNTYAIAKLADGKCWMIENLRLQNTATSNSDGSLAQGYNSSFAGLANPEGMALFSNVTTANTLYSIDGSTNKTISGSNQGYRFPRYNSETNGNSVYSYGNYYTWAAAIADTSYYDTKNQSIVNTSICPAGWRLPTGGAAYANGDTGGVNVTGDASTFRDFYNLGYAIMGSSVTAYEDNSNSGSSYYTGATTNPNGDTAALAFPKYPNNFIRPGYIFSNILSNPGSEGCYWSSTVSNNNRAYLLDVSTTQVHPGTYVSNKYYGGSIRCLVDS